MSSASTPAATVHNLVVEGVSAQAPRGLDLRPGCPAELTWRPAPTLATGPRGAELELTTASGTQTATVAGSASVLVDWPFTALRPRTTSVSGSGSRGRRSHVRLERSAADPRRLPRRGGVGRHPDRRRRHRRQRRSPDWLGPSSRSPARSSPAVLYATALGVYQASVNGADVDDQVLKPGWTPYQWRLDPRDHRRDRPAAAGTQRDRDPFRRRLGDRAVRLPRSAPPRSTPSSRRWRGSW